MNSDLKLAALREWARLEAQLAAPPAPVRARAPVAPRVLGVVAKLLLFAVLPFLILVRVSVLWYSHFRSPTWLALVVGVCGMVVVVTAYAAWLSQRLTGRARVFVIARRVALPLVLAYVGYTLVYLSSVNAKSEGVRGYYASLHPLLRVALSTWILVDRDIVITDVARRRGDYGTLGLPVNEGSLHYRQPDGYVHAADLRTAGRSFVKNRLVQLYLWTMGFETRRHVGTADHLHVELPAR
ncbi:MAG TPA: hypothetical protein VFU41_07900 [Gemmatimonadales bacterium]|nr:hypothetical protein [Gemmatimonadales bacterium]